MRRLIAGCVLAGALAAPAPAAAQGLAPGTPPPGANDFSCRPSEQHPAPVVLVHGTFGDMTVSFRALSRLLADRGHCVFALDYGSRATAPLDQSADQIAAFARRVLETTGAPKVSFVGHSQGGLQARYVAKLKGLLPQTQDIVGMAPSNHGTDTPLGPLAGAICDACREQLPDSEPIRRVNEGEEAPAPASYTVISTKYDQVATPYTSQALAGPPERVTNVVLQDRCPQNNTEHLFIAALGPGDPVANQWALNALEREGPANPRFEPDCTGRTLGLDPDPQAASEASPLRLELLGRRVAVRGTRIALRARCSGPSGTRCRSRVIGRNSRGTLATGRSTIGAGRTGRLSLRLNRRGRSALRAGSIRLLVSARTAGGEPRLASRTYSVRRVRR